MSATDRPPTELDLPRPNQKVGGASWRRSQLWLGIISAVIILGVIAVVLVDQRRTPATGTPIRQTHSVRRGDLAITLVEQGIVESSSNTEIRCKIRGGYGGRGGQSLVTWVIPPGTFVEAGDDLVHLDTKVIDETISLGKTDTNSAKAQLAQAEAEAEVAQSSLEAYLSGTYRAEHEALDSQLATAEWHLESAKSTLEESRSLYRRGYISKFEIEASEYTVRQAELQRDAKRTEIDVLERFTKSMQLERLQGQVEATQSRLEGRRAGFDLERGRLELAIAEREYCTITAPRAGIVIYPSAAKWKDTPDIAKGVSVHNHQLLLIMPDLQQMQVNTSFHESIVDRIKPGHSVRIQLSGQMLESQIHSVATIATPAGWWNGNEVRYEASVRLPPHPSLRPGMTAEVEVTLSEHPNELLVPVAAVIENIDGHFCWVETTAGEIELRSLTLGANNAEAIVVADGLSEGEMVVLHPFDSLPEARAFLHPTAVHPVRNGELKVTVTEQGTLASSNNTEIKSQVRGESTVNWVIENGTIVKAGDVLVRLENKQIEDHLRERTKFAFLSKDAAIGFRVEANVAKLAVEEYLEGTYRIERLRLEQDLAVAQQDLLTAQNLLAHLTAMQEQGYKSSYDVLEQQSAVRQAERDVKGKKLELHVLQNYTRQEQLVTLQGNWRASEEAAKGHEEVLKNDEARVARALAELDRCVIRAPRDGLVIYPQGDEWDDEPEISSGSSVHNNQVLLLMPDLSRMHVEVGVHQSMVGKIAVGTKATVTTPQGRWSGEIATLNAVAKPAGLWAGNMVKHDATIRLPATVQGLKPGMSAQVDIEVATYENATIVPINAVVEIGRQSFCWVGTADQAARRRVEIGDANKSFAIVQSGLQPGDQVVVDPHSWFELGEPRTH